MKFKRRISTTKYLPSDTVRHTKTGKTYHVLAYSEKERETFLAVDCHANPDEFIELTESETELVKDV